MKIAVITLDQIIVIDGEGLHIPFEMKGGEWAVHWDSRLGTGEVEYTDSRLNETITSFEKYQYLIDLFVDEKARIEAERAAAEAEAIANATNGESEPA